VRGAGKQIDVLDISVSKEIAWLLSRVKCEKCACFRAVTGVTGCHRRSFSVLRSEDPTPRFLPRTLVAFLSPVAGGFGFFFKKFAVLDQMVGEKGDLFLRTRSLRPS